MKLAYVLNRHRKVCVVLCAGNVERYRRLRSAVLRASGEDEV